jgi:hypothetical protein
LVGRFLAGVFAGADEVIRRKGRTREERLAAGTGSSCGGILVVVDGSRSSWSELERAASLARCSRARLEIIGVTRFNFCAFAVPSPSFDPRTLKAAVEERFELDLRAAIAALPDDISVCSRVLHSRGRRHLSKLIQAGLYDFVFAPRGPRAFLRGFLPD